jgi:hypothetical protein
LVKKTEGILGVNLQLDLHEMLPNDAFNYFATLGDINKGISSDNTEVIFNPIYLYSIIL